MSAGRVLGANLRARRDEQGISLSELARRSGIAKGTLSQLESGSGNPTIETVFSLSNALGVPVSALLNEAPTAELVVVRGAETGVLSGEAIDLRMLRRVEPAGGLFEIYTQDVRPDAVQHSDGHPGIEHHVVLSGRLRVTSQGRSEELGPGDYLAFRAAGPHEYAAVGGPVRSVLLLEYPPDAAPGGPGPHPLT
ncbi:helix-turn-helix transcriptional regulator [Kribbella sandramycini]|uniref:Helix-turn-helix transcriptional regulator n=1 Tax=Kribbella sandramycini TaxID=60450 RepID=A0A7Y4KZ35_9ACTN|nr:XRE family transcriptional regulator [Kribbella sandramycini]MBB6565052.1 transcriptional regulator with XRE-family HTH domain [Kribbella sandramycini]NOL41324.1 helix-turn-helix transcriptional regulator [Kribbella sandramycini]